jgi:cytoskeletal protein RodZ
MKPVGKQLQEARLARNWTPELAARETKIKVDRLRDLEADDYTHFSSPTYARGFVRTYARALGLDEYKILRQLDTKLPEDETSSFGTDTGIPYVPEPSKPGQAGSGSNTGLYVVLSLGMAVVLVISFILFESYRAGVLPGYFTENASVEPSVAPTASEAPPGAETPPARAKPLDPNAPLPPINADNGDTSSAPKALPVDPNALAVTTDTNTPPKALPVDPNSLAATTDPNTPPKALPVDPNSLAATTDPNTSPKALPVDPNSLAATTDPNTPPKALPVDPNSLAATPDPNTQPKALPVGSGDPTAQNPAAPDAPVVSATNAAPKDPSAQAPATPLYSPSARQSNSGSVQPPQPATAQPAITSATNDVSQGEASTDSSVQKRLVLTASRDSFVRVTSEDGPGAEKVLYASVIHTGQSVGFDGHKFSINVGIPAAVDITLDGVNYGPHSDQETPETFPVESHQP